MFLFWELSSMAWLGITLRAERLHIIMSCPCPFQPGIPPFTGIEIEFDLSWGS